MLRRLTSTFSGGCCAWVRPLPLDGRLRSHDLARCSSFFHRGRDAHSYGFHASQRRSSRSSPVTSRPNSLPTTLAPSLPGSLLLPLARSHPLLLSRHPTHWKPVGVVCVVCVVCVSCVCGRRRVVVVSPSEARRRWTKKADTCDHGRTAAAVLSHQQRPAVSQRRQDQETTGVHLQDLRIPSASHTTPCRAWPCEWTRSRRNKRRQHNDANDGTETGAPPREPNQENGKGEESADEHERTRP